MGCKTALQECYQMDGGRPIPSHFTRPSISERIGRERSLVLLLVCVTTASTCVDNTATRSTYLGVMSSLKHRHPRGMW